MLLLSLLKRSHLKIFCCARAGNFAIKCLKIDYKISDQTDYESRTYRRTINWPRKNKEEKNAYCVLREFAYRQKSMNIVLFW